MVKKLRSQWKRLLVLAGIVVIYATPVMVVRGAFDAFLKIDGVAGESADAKHKDWIEVLSFSHGATQPGTTRFGAGGGGGAGKVAHKDLIISKRYDKASPLLFMACSSGQHLKSVQLEMRKSSGDKFTYLKYKLSDVLVSSVSVGGSSSGGDSVPTESISLNYAKIEWSYTVQNPDGSAGAAVHGGWDLAQNKKL